MITIKELYDELAKLTTEERVLIVLLLMKNDKLSYQDITTAYTEWLEFKREQISEDYQMLKGKVLEEWVEPKNRVSKLKDTMHYLLDKGQINITHEQINEHE